MFGSGYALGMLSRIAIRVVGIGLTLSCIGLAHGQDEFTLSDGEWEAAESSASDPVIQEARALLAADQPGEAKQLLDPWIAAHKYSEHADLPDAYLLRGDAKLMMGNEYQALYDYEAIAKQFYGTPAFPKAIEREAEIANRYLNGLKRKWFGWLRLERATTLGEELMIRVQERMPGSQLAEQAALDLGDYYYRGRDLPLAADMYGIIVRNYPDSRYRKFAALREIYANIAAFKGPSYDRSPLVEARILIDDFQMRYPADAEQAGITTQLETWVDESDAAHLLNTAKWYLNRGDEASARLTFRRLIGDNTESAAAKEAVQVMIDRAWLDAPTNDSETEAPIDASP